MYTTTLQKQQKIHKILVHAAMNVNAFAYSNRFDEQSMNEDKTYVTLSKWDVLVFGYLRLLSQDDNVYIPKDVLLLCVSFCKAVSDEKWVGVTNQNRSRCSSCGLSHGN